MMDRVQGEDVRTETENREDCSLKATVLDDHRSGSGCEVTSNSENLWKN